jgi:hypothetical protein
VALIQKTAIPLLVVTVAIACGGGGTVARYALCSAADTCPSQTVCESPTATGTGEGTFCTYSCTQNSDCPSDSSGVSGVCLPMDVSQGSSQGDYGFCFQSCAAGSCPGGGLCIMTTSYSLFDDGTTVSACIPGSGATDPLSGTTWRSTSIAPTAIQNGVTSSTYDVTFGTGTVVESTSEVVALSGAFTATFSQMYTMGQYAGCMETTTFTGGTWTDATTPGDATSGGIAVSGATGTTNRMSCQLPSADLTDQTGLYDSAVDTMGGTSFTITGTTMSLPQSAGVTPYVDGNDWTFTKM